MKGLSVLQLRKFIQDYAKKQKLEMLPHTSTVSWLYPGQFTYCLNEEFMWDRYGTLIDCPEEVHFNKIQPCICWDDFEDFFIDKQEKIRTHLCSFDMTTINGGHIIPKQKMNEYSAKIFEGLIDFLIVKLGLERERLVITYFPGGKLSELNQNSKGIPKYNFEYEFPSDEYSIKLFLSLGISKKQIKQDSSRNCFLIPDWACREPAPWGFRNEIYYKTKGGLLDIATIERLVYRPTIKDDRIVSIKDWDKCFIINGTGIERLSMLLNGSKDIYEISNIAPLFKYINNKKYTNPVLVCESIRALHRLIADTSGNMYDSRSKNPPRERKRKLNIMRRVFLKVSQNELTKLFELNAKLNPWYPELKKSVKKCIKVIKEYKESQMDWKDLRNLKNG